jgi:uncharacterized protein YndB with AHSA1/START domain
MTERNVTHATFVIERTYGAAPARVFNAFADAAAKARWFVGPDEWERSEFDLDFRVGGREVNRGGPPGGPVHVYEARYHDIVPNERIITTYEMYMDDTRSSISIATIEFEPAGDGTTLRLTEQGAFLDGTDSVASREQGTRELLDALGEALKVEATPAGRVGSGARAN